MKNVIDDVILRLLHQVTTPRQHESNTCPKCEGTGLNLRDYAYELKDYKMVPYHPKCLLCKGTKTVDTVPVIGVNVGVPDAIAI